MDKKYKPVALIILDGWGYRKEKENNPIAEANTPYFDYLWQTYPHETLGASGPDVGMPEGQIGNSEVCHMTIGAGRVIETDLVRINKAIANGQFAENPAFLELFSHIKKNNSCLHILGLLSPGGVHSHIEHLFAFLKIAKASGITNIAIHAIVDGRDVLPQSEHIYLKQLEDFLTTLGVGRIASVCGRYYAMDRDNNLDRTDIFESLIFDGRGEQLPTLPPSKGVAKLHESGSLPLDELMRAYSISENNGQANTIRQNDGVFFFNFRPDRARQIAAKIDARVQSMNLCFVTMTKFDHYKNTSVAFEPLAINTTLAKEISQAGLTQTHIAETEKFAHATYFLNGGSEKKSLGEKQILITSRKDIKTHDEAPEMRAEKIADTAISEITSGIDFIFINFANADMVGHTSNVPAIIKAVEFLDIQIKRVTEAVLAKGGAVIISADHGNAEYTFSPNTHLPHTAHTTNRVPVIITVPDLKLKTKQTIANLATTTLELLGLKKPMEMENGVIDQ
jgi:2,3-bisphosphoglycerate-independent phosphoglycerate mutase